MAAGKEEKLTKKQRKALEFKKGAKAADKRAANDEEDGARAEASSVVEAPQAELSRVQKAEEPEVDGDNEEQNQEEEEEEDVQEEGAGKRVAAKGSATRSKEEKRKAKRDAKKLRIKEKKAGGKKAGASNGSEPTKAPGNGSEATGEEDEEEDEETKAKKRDTKSRFIVFVGECPVPLFPHTQPGLTLLLFVTQATWHTRQHRKSSRPTLHRTAPRRRRCAC